MRDRLTPRDRWLLATTLPLFVVVFAAHVYESARTGLAQLPVFAKWNPGDYPQVGGYRLETDSSGSGLEPGDRLIRVGERDLRGVGYIGFHAIGLSLTTPGHPVPLLVERAGRRFTVPLEARPHPHRWSRIPVLLLIPLFCVLLLLRAPGQPEVWRFYLPFMTYAIGQAQFYGGPEWQSWVAAVVWNVASTLMLFFLLRWVRLFPPELPVARRVPAALPWVATALYVIFVRANYILTVPLPVEWVPRVSFAVHGLMSLVGVLILAWNYAFASPAGRRRLRWMLLGTALGSLPVIGAGVAPLLMPGWEGFRDAFAVGFLSSAIWLMGAALATVRDDAFDVDRLIGATTAWSLAAGAAIALLAIGVPAIAGALSATFGIEPMTTRLGLAAVLGAIAIPLGMRLRPEVDRWLFPERVALREGAARLGDELLRCAGPAELLTLAARGGAELLGADGFAIHARETGGVLTRLAAGSLEVERTLTDERVLPRQVRPRNAPPGPAPGDSLVVPLRTGESLDALLWFGPKRSGDIYTSHDAGVMESLAARVERELLRFQKLASDRESRQKTDLLAAAGHDLRQPLHAVSLLAEALHGKLDDPEIQGIVERIGASTHDLDAMLTSLLDRSQLDAGRVQPEIDDVPLARVFEQLERDFAPQAESSGQRLRIVPSELVVRSDRILLSRILANLVSNALRYSKGAAVLVGARRRGERVRIEVRDGGPGIAPESQREIFEAFRQLPGSDRGGLGLGLSIVEGLCQVLGHTLDLRSRPGGGSTFALELPRSRTRPSARSAEKLEVPPAVGRVLIVDDDAPVRAATQQLLRSWGCEVRVAASEPEALAALADGWRPGFVLADQHLGDGAIGSELIDRLRARLGASLPAAIVTAETSPEELQTMRERGDPVLRKPVRPAQLRGVLSALPPDPQAPDRRRG